MVPRWIMVMLLAALAVAPLTACEKTTKDTDIKRLSIGEAKALWDRQQRGDKDLVLFIDPRPAKYYNAARIPGAEHIELPKFDRKDKSASRDPRLDKFTNLVVYGDDPANPVAKGMTKRLLEFDYRHVRWFAGGMKEWKERGYPAHGTPEPAPPPAPPPAEPAAPTPSPEPASPR